MGRWFYAVRVGRKPGVYDTWPECESQVKSFPKARFKKFPLREQALDFIKGSPGKPWQPPVVTDPPVSHPPPAPVAVPPVSVPPSVAPLAESASYNTGCRGRNTNKVLKSQLIAPSACACCPMHTAGAGQHHPMHTAGQHHHPHEPGKRYASTSSHQQKNKRQKIDVNAADRVAVYTDGCCTSNGRRGARAGLGVYWGPEHPRNISERVTGRQTNQRAEIMAAVRAIESAHEMNIKTLTIYTDSMFTINCMTKWIFNWKRNDWKTKTGSVVNKDEIIELDRMCRQVNVNWVHVPGHNNIHGNEEADRLAKAGASQSLS